MKRTCLRTMVMPNMPLRRPSTSPGDAPVSPKTFTPSIGTPERPLVTLNGDGGTQNVFFVPVVMFFFHDKLTALKKCVPGGAESIVRSLVCI